MVLNNTTEEETTDRGVSPVVGVILMVAITVILAAIIAAFVMDLGGSMQQNANAAMEVTQEADGTSGTDGDTSGAVVTARLVSLDNADSVTVQSGSNGNVDACDGTTNSGKCEITTVGNTAQIDGVSAGDTITITATLDGSSNVIQTYTVKEAS